ncbi:MAG: helix-turn-helix transcriptional regulator [Lachnospiraceae bacterium]|nr:helix-turn-helix transcriptional regulator [Lachnospiraceae bacterium]
MSFSYKNLWNTLERYNMSKTDLRQTLGFSTATLAKLSADQPVALDVLDKICEKLGCSFSDIIAYKSDTVTSLPWSTISPEQTYLINLYFYHTTEQTTYVYGFATPYHITEEGMNHWKLSQAETNHIFYIMRGYITGAKLLTFIQSAQNKETIGQLLEENNITLHSKKCTKDSLEAIYALSICNGNSVYRPKYLLTTHEETAGLTVSLKPQHSFEDTAMYCESLFGRNKQFLYNTDGSSDCKKLEAIWQLLKEELPIRGNLNELSRINNFEIFSPLLPCIDAKEAIHWKVDCREKHGEKIPEYISVQLDHHFLQGEYLVNVQAYNTQNAFLDRTIQVYCGEEDIHLHLPLQESISLATVKVWQVNTHNADSNLIYSSTHSLMRHIHMDMHLIHRTFQIEDAWTKKIDKTQSKENAKTDYKKGQYSSLHPISISDNSEEYWVSEEAAIKKEARLLLGTYHPLAEKGIFLPEGPESHLQFLTWLKMKLSTTDIHRVVLIDPYITAESINKMLRSISNSSIAYEIITDSSASSHKDSSRIPNIKKMVGFLDVLQPGSLKIRTISTSKPFLHDRFLFLLGKESQPIVYILSNSLDNVAEQHTSVIMPTDNQLAKKIFEYYTTQFANFKESGHLEMLYDSEKGKKIPHKQKPASTVSDGKKIYTPEDFVMRLASDFPSTLASLAYMQPKTKETCLKRFMDMDNEEVIPPLLSILDDYLILSSQNEQTEGNSLLLSTAQLLLQLPDSQGSLLQNASWLPDHCYEYQRNHCGWSVHFAIELLWKKDPVLYCDRLSALKHKLEEDRSFSDHRIFRLAASMIGHLATELAFHAEAPDLSVLFQSDLPLLRALATTAVLSLPQRESINSSLIDSQVGILKKHLSGKELVLTELYQIKELQVLIYQKPNDHERLQPVIDELINHVVDTITTIASVPSENNEFSDDDLYHYLLLLYSRNSEDICQIIQRLCQSGYYSTEAANNHLVALFLEKYKKGFSDSNEIFTKRDLQESRMILQYIEQTDIKGISKIKSEIKKLERPLQERLYHAFLKAKNYRQWKSSIDLFCCLVFIELWVSENYQFTPSQAVKELQMISENFKTTLENYSEVYQALLCYFPKMKN